MHATTVDNIGVRVCTLQFPRSCHGQRLRGPGFEAMLVLVSPLAQLATRSCPPCFHKAGCEMRRMCVPVQLLQLQGHVHCHLYIQIGLEGKGRGAKGIDQRSNGAQTLLFLLLWSQCSSSSLASSSDSISPCLVGLQNSKSCYSTYHIECLRLVHGALNVDEKKN